MNPQTALGLHLSEPHRSEPGRSIVMGALAVVVLVGGAELRAAWPTVPGDPRVLGTTSYSESAPPSVVVAPDGAAWFAWVNHQCDGVLRLQRVAADGTLLGADALSLQTFPGCHATEVLLAPCADGCVVTAIMDEAMTDPPVHRVAPDGRLAWDGGIVLTVGGGGRLLGLFALDGGDVLIVRRVSGAFWCHRVDAAGRSLWDTSIEATAAARVPGIVPDGQGGVFIFWDHAAGGYFRRLRVTRLHGDGTAAWKGEWRDITPVSPFASRHTPPAFTPDGSGGVWIAYTRGGQQFDSGAPVVIQRLRTDGSLDFDPVTGMAVSSVLTSQHGARIAVEPGSGELFVLWRDGAYAPRTLRAQRMSVAGARLWAPAGVEVRPLSTGFSTARFSAWPGENMLRVLVADSPVAPDGPGIELRQVLADGTVSGDVWPVADAAAAIVMDVAETDDSPAPAAQVIAWLRREPGNPSPIAGEVVAQRVNADGSLGLPDVSVPGDLDGDGLVGFADLLLLLAAWGPCADPPAPCDADLNGTGVVEFGDLLELLALWSA